MPSVTHFGKFPPARYTQIIGGSQKLFIKPCIELVDIIYSDTIDQRLVGDTLFEIPFRESLEDPRISPFKITEKEALDAYWRVKKWRVEWTQALGEEDPPEPQDSEEYDAGFSEKNLVCGSGNQLIAIADDVFPFGAVNLNFGFNTSNALLRPILTNNQNEYFLNIRISDFFSDKVAVVTSEKKEDPLTWELTADTYDEVGPDEYELSDLGPTQVRIYPIEWWPYDPQDGNGPIYNSSTGGQIRGF